MIGTQGASVLLGFLHVAAWSTYMGGILVMELAWRPAQKDMPPSQTAVACQWMGRRYRWISLMALLVAGLSGILRASVVSLRSPSVPADPFSLGHSYGRTLMAGIAVWAIQLAILATLAVLAHPALHVRTPAEMDESARQEARQKVRRAIRRMDILLRTEIALALLALLLGASLAHGGLF